MAMTEVLRGGAELYRRWSQAKEPSRDVVGEHQRILDTVLARDETAAVAALADPYRCTAEILERAYAGDGGQGRP